MSKHITAKWTSSTQQTSFSRAARLAGCLKVGKQQLVDIGKDSQKGGNYVNEIEKRILRQRAHGDKKRSSVLEMVLCWNIWAAWNKTHCAQRKTKLRHSWEHSANTRCPSVQTATWRSHKPGTKQEFSVVFITWRGKWTHELPHLHFMHSCRLLGEEGSRIN